MKLFIKWCAEDVKGKRMVHKADFCFGTVENHISLMNIYDGKPISFKKLECTTLKKVFNKKVVDKKGGKK